MKFLIAIPPYVHMENLGPQRVGIPIGMLSIAACAEKAGHQVKVIDSRLYESRHWERLEADMREFNPDVIGISNLFSTQLDGVKKFYRMIKGINRDAKTIVGGPHATSKPHDFLNMGIDVAMVGEGENAIGGILAFFEGMEDIRNVKGVAYMEGGKIKITGREFVQNLDDVPFPAYHLADMERYFELNEKGFSSRPHDIFNKPVREISMITSRGCPYECTFCSIHPTMGYVFRAQSPEYVVKHIELVVKKYGVQLIHFEDDNLTLDASRFNAMLDMIEEKGLGFRWDTPNGVRVDTLDYDLLKKMKRTNVAEVRIAIESASQHVLDNIVRKELDIKKAIEVCKHCDELGISISAFFVVGMPGETKADIMGTLDLAYDLMKRHNVKPHVNIANPLVGTEMYNIAKLKGYLVEDDLTKGSIFSVGKIRTEEFTPEDVKKMTNRFYKKVRNLYIRKKLTQPSAIARDMKILITHPKSTLNMLRTSMKYAE